MRSSDRSPRKAASATTPGIDAPDSATSATSSGRTAASVSSPTASPPAGASSVSAPQASVARPAAIAVTHMANMLMRPMKPATKALAGCA
jgi:hypothetical protein